MKKTIRQSLMRFRRVPVVLVQLLLVALSYWIAFLLRFDGNPPAWAMTAFVKTVGWLVVVRGFTFVPFRLYQGLWKYTGIYDLQMLAAGVLASSIVFTAIVTSLLALPDGYPRAVLIIDAMLVLMMLGGIRTTRRVVAEFGWSDTSAGRRVLVYGAGSIGQMIVREMRQNPSLGNRPVGFVDDDPSKHGRRVHGVRVFGGLRDIAEIVERTDPTEVLLALPAVDPAEVRRIVRSLESFNVPIKTLPSLRDIFDGRVGVEQIRTLKVEDLLARPVVGLDANPVRRLIGGRCVLVTGAGGSIGSELCRQVLSFRPSALILFERYENSLHALRLELTESAAAKGVSVFAVVGDVTDVTLLASVFKQYTPQLVFHAAAHKHVPLMEENPCEAVKNNVRGTRLLAAAAEAAGVDRFILISTDKAANPSSIMGASKRLAELAIHAQSQGSGTSFSIVRFGNVLGSNGSVVPRFMEQIQKGGPVTVTHPEVRRFFMLIPEAVQLVLHAAADAKTGRTYVLEMGEQVKLVDIARNLIRLSGRVPDEDIKITFTGLRPGEKLQEELFGASEELVPSAIPKVLMVDGHSVPSSSFMEAVLALETSALGGRTAEVVSGLSSLVGLTRDGRPAPVPVVSSSHRAPAAPIAERFPELVLDPCPECGSRCFRTKGRRLDQRVRKYFSELRPFRCPKCKWQGWMLPADPATQPAVLSMAVGSPDLEALDRVGGQGPRRARQTFSPKDLQ